MIGTVIPVAFISGALVALWVFSGQRLDYSLILFYFAQTRSKQKFEAFYDLTDDEASWSLNRANKHMPIDTYADYLRLHESARKSAYGRFQTFYNALTKVMFVCMLPIALVPAIIFWSHWSWYLLGFVVVTVTLIAYDMIIRNHRVGFYQRMVIGMTLLNYLRDQDRKR